MAVFAVAPSVQFTERDATLFVQATMNVSAAFVGVSRWGAVDSPIHITGGEQDLVKKIYAPDGDTYLDFFMMADYGRYSKEWQFLRMVGENARNSVNSDAGAAPIVNNKEDFESLSFVSDVTWVGRYPGSLGNSVAIHIVDRDTYDGSEFNEYFNFKPQVGEYTVALIDTTGTITGGAAAVRQQEKLTITGNEATGVGTLVFNGTTVNYSSGDTSAEIVAAMKTTLEATDDINAVNTTTVPGVKQVETFTIGGTATATGTLTIGGVDTAVTTGDTDAEVATAVAAAFNADSGYSATLDGTIVTITHAAAGAHLEITVDAAVAGITVEDISIVTAGYEEVSTATIVFENALLRTAQTKPEDVNGLIFAYETTVTGSMGTIISEEVYEVLQNTPGSKKTTGANAYYYEVLKNGSSLVYAVSKAGLSAGNIWLSKGVDDYNVSRVGGYQEFQNTELYDVSTIVGVGTIGEQQAAVDASVTRRDSITFISPQQDDVVGARGRERDNVIEWRNEELLRDNSYTFIDDNWAVVYDKYNDTERLIPACGGTAGLYARAISLAGPWLSPAFLNRGKYIGYRRMSWKPNATDRKELYKNQINSVITRKEGIILWGDKTALSRPSAFGHINVRGTFIMIEKNIANTAEYYLGENNDVYTRSLFTNTVRPYLRDLESRGAIIEGRVKCDETNNTGQIIATNQMVAGIWIKPQYSINWIFLDFAALRPDMSFEELEGSTGITAA